MVATATFLFIAVVAARSGTASGTTAEIELTAKGLGPLRAFVYLPPGYEASQARYPVVYFLHGLPASSSSFRSAVPRAALRHAGRKAIVVVPQGARDGDADDEYLDRGPGRNWETAIATELPAYVDRHFRTLAGRHGRAIIGISAGGYGALAIGIHHLDTFSVIESWSGYGQPTNPAGTQLLDLGSSRANERASIHAAAKALRGTFARRPTFLGFYVGSKDSRFLGENVRLDRELNAAKVPHLFAVYPGGHTQSLWSEHADRWVGLALGHLESATSR